MITLNIATRTFVKNVTSLSEVIQFCKDNGINDKFIDKRSYDDTFRVVGEEDMLVNEKLEYRWLTDIERKKEGKEIY